MKQLFSVFVLCLLTMIARADYCAQCGKPFTVVPLRDGTFANDCRNRNCESYRVFKDNTQPRKDISDDEKPTGMAAKLLETMYDVAPSADYEDLNCVQFMAKALAKAGFKIGAAARKRILMSDVPERGPQLEKLLYVGDAQVCGAPAALVNSGQARYLNQGERPKPGDVVQYWYSKDGVRIGHSGIVEKVSPSGRVDLYGSHSSVGGVGTLEGVNLSTKYRFSIARPLR